MSSLWSEQLVKMLMKPQSVNHHGAVAPAILDSTTTEPTSQEAKAQTQATAKMIPQPIPSEHMVPQNENHPRFHFAQANTIEPNFLSQTNLSVKPQPLIKHVNQAPARTQTEVTKSELDQLIQFTSAMNQHNLVNDTAFLNQNNVSSQLQSSPWLTQPHLDSNVVHTQQIDAPQLDSATLSGLLPYPDNNEWNSHYSSQFLRSPGSSSVFKKQEPAVNPTSMGHEMRGHQMNNSRFLSQPNQLAPLPQPDQNSLQYISNQYGLKDLSDESHNQQTDIYSCLNFDGSNGGSTLVDASVSSTVLDEFCTFKDGDFQNPSDYLVGNFSSSQDVQSQITSASLAESQAFSLQEFPDISGGTSSSNAEFDDNGLLQNNSWQQVAPRVRTYTKVKTFHDLYLYIKSLICAKLLTW